MKDNHRYGSTGPRGYGRLHQSTILPHLREKPPGLTQGHGWIIDNLTLSQVFCNHPNQETVLKSLKRPLPLKYQGGPIWLKKKEVGPPNDGTSWWKVGPTIYNLGSP